MCADANEEGLQLASDFMMMPFSSKTLQKVGEPFEDANRLSILISFLATLILFGLGGFRRDSIDVEVRIAAKEDADAHFTFEVEAFSLSGRLGELKHDTFDSLFKGGKIEISLGT